MELENNHKIKFAIAGYGHIGRRHIAEVTGHEDAELIAIVENESEAAEKASACGVPVYHNLETLFANHSDIDVLNICTPNGYHIPMAMAGIAAGVHVLVEKPMGLSKTQCDALMTLASEKQKQVFCVLQNRYSPPAEFINEMINNQSLGEIYWVAINCYWNRDTRYYTPGSWRGTKDLDGGPLYTQFSHFIDLLFWNFGPLKNIDGVFFNNNHPYLDGIEDTGTFNFEFERGGAGQFSYSTALYQTNLESSITIIGAKGTIKAGGQYMEKIDFFTAEGLAQPELAPALPANDYGLYKGSAANHAFVIDNVIKALKGQHYEMASAEEAAASVDIIERVYKIRDSKKRF